MRRPPGEIAVGKKDIACPAVPDFRNHILNGPVAITMAEVKALGAEVALKRASP